MTRTEGFYFDGRSAARRAVEIAFDASGISIRGEGVELDFDLDEVRITSRLGDSARYVHLPDGGKCEIRDNDAVDAALAGSGGHRGEQLLHRLESRMGYALAALVLTAGLLWAFLFYGVPAIAERVAHALPPEAEAALGRQGLEALDRAFFEPSELDARRRERLHATFRAIVESEDVVPVPSLELRSAGPLGPNAFALPSGIVVLTDELVAIAGNDEEIAAVLAHELGHVHERHVLRQMLQSSLTAVLAAALLGDVTSVTGLAAALPTFLLEMRHSREFEREADAFAAGYLRAAGIPVSRLGEMLERLEAAHGVEEDDEFPTYLSSHPPTSERLRALGGDEAGR